MDSKRTKTSFTTYKPLSFDMFNGVKKNPIDIEAKVLHIAWPFMAWIFVLINVIL